MDDFDQNTLTPPVTPPVRNPLIAFRIHAIVYAATIALLAVFDRLTGEPYWVLYVVAGWGIGIVAHGLTAFLKRRASHSRI